MKHFINHNCRYALISRCWSESPDKRPFFEDLVHEVDSLLISVAGYLEFSTFSAEVLAESSV